MNIIKYICKRVNRLRMVPLTPEQQQRYINEMFEHLTSVYTNKNLAENAVRDILGSYIPSKHFHWVSKPSEVVGLYNNLITDKEYKRDNDYLIKWISGDFVNVIYSNIQKCNDSLKNQYLINKFNYYMTGTQNKEVINGKLDHSKIMNIFRVEYDLKWIGSAILLYKNKCLNISLNEYKILKEFEELIKSCSQVYIMNDNIIMVEKPFKIKWIDFILSDVPVYKITWNE